MYRPVKPFADFLQNIISGEIKPVSPRVQDLTVVFTFCTSGHLLQLALHGVVVLLTQSCFTKPVLSMAKSCMHQQAV